MIYAGILAAGLGLRMHRQDLPKQFLPLGEKPIIIHTLEQFFINARVDRIIVVAPDLWLLYAEDLISKHNSMGKPVNFISGGVSKTESVYSVLRYIESTWGFGENDILISHDAIRPFITQRIINDNIDTALKYGTANTVMTTSDTIITSKDGETLTEVPPKETMFAEQTPQTFKLGLLKHIFEESAKDNISLKEESELARLFLRRGQTVRMVLGEYSNMKIINPYDLEVANALLKERKL